MHPISVDKQQQILSLLQRPLSSKKVALLCNVSYTTVQKLCRKHLPDLELSVGGRPQKLSQQNKHYCIRAVTSGKMKTAIEVQQDLEINLDIKVDESTI
jgi:transposase